jgi:hypothetical protein
MPPHGHGGDEEEEVIVVRTDGPPFVDLKAKQGRGFEADFDKVQVCLFMKVTKNESTVLTRFALLFCSCRNI